MHFPNTARLCRCLQPDKRWILCAHSPFKNNNIGLPIAIEITGIKRRHSGDTATRKIKGRSEPNHRASLAFRKINI